MRIAILGFGSVGRGLAEVLSQRDLGITITAIADSRSGLVDPSGIPAEKILERKRTTGMCGEAGITADEILARGEFDLLVEVTPTNAETGEPALGYIRQALGEGIHVVTSNKGPIAVAYPELAALAREHGAELRFEATVCGAIPLMLGLRNGLAGNAIRKISGVFNGTCNYILTRMADEGLTYTQALAEARELGYAEADPTYDVKGIDAAIKLVILANTIFGMDKRLSDVEITGIESLTTDSFALVEDDDCTLRLIGEIIPEKEILRVSPRILPRNHVLVVENTLNAVTIEADLAGEVTFIGKGAGSRETASAILSDILFIREFYDQRA